MSQHLKFPKLSGHENFIIAITHRFGCQKIHQKRILYTPTIIRADPLGIIKAGAEANRKKIFFLICR